MFASNFDASSFISHQYAIAGQASSSVDFPASRLGVATAAQDTIATLTQQRTYGAKNSGVLRNQTLGDELDEAALSWRYYTSSVEDPTSGIWSAYQAIKHIRYGPDWNTDVVSPQTRFFKDVTNGKLPAVSWVTPTCANSDHAGCESNHGPHVGGVAGQRYRNLKILEFDRDLRLLGRLRRLVRSRRRRRCVDYDGLGIRVPLLVVSPYAKKGYVSHVQYEHGSILRFVEDQFGLARLAASDTRATSPERDCFDFSSRRAPSFRSRRNSKPSISKTNPSTAAYPMVNKARS